MSMQKGKHQGGQNQGFSRFPPNAYPQRQPAPQRGSDVFHVTSGYPPQAGGGPGGGPSGGPQMRVGAVGMSMPQGSQQQGPGGPGGPGPAPTSTPPGPGHSAADINKGLHMQGQGQLQGGMIYQPRQSNANNFYRGNAPAPRLQRANQVYSVQNGNQIVPGQSFIPLHYISGNLPIQTMPFRPTAMNAPPQNYYPSQTQQHVIYPHSPLFMSYQSVRSPVNPQGPPHNLQSLQSTTPHGPNQNQIIPVSSTLMPTVTPPAPTGGNAGSQSQQKRRRHALTIVDPNSGRNVLEDMEREASASGGSSNRETPQPESMQNHNVAAEFAERVGKAASEDSTPSGPTQPPDLSQAMSSMNGPPQPEPSSDPSISQSYIEDNPSIGNSWKQGGLKGPELGEKHHEPANVYVYHQPVIAPHSANSYQVQEVLQPSMGPMGTMVVHGVIPSRSGTHMNSLALNEQTPVVSANTNAPSFEVIRNTRGSQHSGGAGSSGHPGSQPSPRRGKTRQENSTAAAAAAANNSSISSTESSSQADSKKKGSPTPSTHASGQVKAQSGSAVQQKEGKREKGRDKNSSTKDVIKDAAVDKPAQPEKSEPSNAASAPVTVAPKGKSPPAAAVSSQPSVTASVAPSPSSTPISKTPSATAPTAAPVSTSAPAVVPASAPSVPSPAPSEPKGSQGRAKPSDTADQETKSKKGKKMRDSNVKGAEKEGSDVEATAEPSLPEESSSAPASAPATEPASASAPVETPQETLAAPRPASPATVADPSVAAPTPTAPAQSPAPAAGDPTESPAAPKSVSESVVPETAPVATPPAHAAPAPTLSAGLNLFNPPFAIPSPPVVLPKATSNKDEKESEKEDKLVAARNEENAKVSGMNAESSDKRQYPADQWSPVNPSGKKKYDRIFLMGLRNDPQSLKKPEGLPELEVVSKDGINKKTVQQNFSNEFSPAGFIRSSNSRGPPPKRGSQQGKPKPGKPPFIQVSLSLREDVKLHETENAWKPGILAGSKEANEEEAKTQELYKKVRGILNKLTPEKFDKLVGQVQNLPIDTPEKLTGVIDLVFDKAVDEPNFSVAYAKMCNELRMKEVEKASFRKILIARCQQEFEKNKEAELAERETKLKEIEKEPDPEKRKELKLMYEEEERKVRMKSVGNIRFIGELYKLGMLTGKIMVRCVGSLLNKEDEESYECLCKLLTTIGKKLESESGDVLGTYFTKMQELADKKRKGRNVSSRVRFMLQDCIDLRANKWIPRRDDSNPKTMTEIQKESERETIETNLMLNSQHNTPRKDDRRHGMGGMDKRGRGPVNSDGWTQAGSRKGMDMNKVSKVFNDSSATTTLGSSNLFQGWSKGSGANSARESVKNIPRNNNPFMALKELNLQNSDRRTSSGPPSKDRSMGGDRGSGSRSGSQQRMSQPASRDSSLARGKREEEQRNRVPTPSSLSDTAQSDQPTPAEEDGGAAEDGGVVQEVYVRSEIKPIEPEEVKRLVRNYFIELMAHKNFQETALGIQDYEWGCLDVFNREFILLSLDQNDGHHVVSQLLGHLIKVNFMEKEHFISGAKEVLELWDDLIYDIPKLWVFLGTIFGGILLTEAVTFKDLASIMLVLKGTPQSCVLLKHIISELVKEQGPSWIRDHFEKEGMKWSDLLSENYVEDFVKENSLESFSGGAQASKRELTQADIQAKLLQLLRNGVSFDAIQEWIEANVGEKTKEPAFARALMTALLENAISVQSNKYVWDAEKLRQDKLLLRYVDNKEKLELQCLYAVQALIVKLQVPQGLMLSIFNTLWDDNLISTEAFVAWFDSDDPLEAEGRGVCKKSLACFQTLLHEGDTEADDEEEHQ